MDVNGGASYMKHRGTSDSLWWLRVRSSEAPCHPKMLTRDVGLARTYTATTGWRLLGDGKIWFSRDCLWGFEAELRQLKTPCLKSWRARRVQTEGTYGDCYGLSVLTLAETSVKAHNRLERGGTYCRLCKHSSGNWSQAALDSQSIE